MFLTRAIYFRRLLAAALLWFSVLLFGCVPMESGSSAILPAAESGATFKVHEYALIEASKDNPNHPEFQNRARAAVSAQHLGWPFSGPENSISAPNQALAPFGYRLENNPVPPFSGFALYQGSQLVQRDIARFLPVSIKKTDGANTNGDFSFTFETINGNKLVADTSGIHPYPGQNQSANSQRGGALLGGQVAYADSIGSEMGVYASVQPIYAGSGNADSFGWQIVAGQPLYFTLNGDLVRLNYAGHDLAYTYDQVVHNKTGDTTIFNPGNTGRVGWFYALRDGLWYYVEVGVFN